jgi:hypothetical protein
MKISVRSVFLKLREKLSDACTAEIRSGNFACLGLLGQMNSADFTDLTDRSLVICC